MIAQAHILQIVKISTLYVRDLVFHVSCMVTEAAARRMRSRKYLFFQLSFSTVLLLFLPVEEMLVISHFLLDNCLSSGLTSDQQCHASGICSTENYYI